MNSRSRPDHWAIKAKRLGYPARSIFKLEEIQQKWRVLRRGKPVLDIGAAPGSWALFALRNLGSGSEVTTVDLKPLKIQAPMGTGLRFFQGDMFSQEVAGFLKIGGPFGCVLSDAAPATSGNRLVDSRKSFELVMRVIDLAEEHLADNGNIVVKVFQGGDEADIRHRLQNLFREVKVFKPRAVRKESMEIYMVGRHYVGTM